MTSATKATSEALTVTIPRLRAEVARLKAEPSRIFHASYVLGRYDFNAYGRTEREARTALLRGVRFHITQTGADECNYEWARDDMNHCDRDVYYDEADERYHHDTEPRVACFAIPAEIPPFGFGPLTFGRTILGEIAHVADTERDYRPALCDLNRGGRAILAVHFGISALPEDMPICQRCVRRWRDAHE